MESKVLVKKRTRSREFALQILYQIDLRACASSHDIDEIVSTVIGDTKNVDIVNFTQELVRGYFENREQIDKSIEQVSKNWKLNRMAVIDRNILRLACFEIMFRKDIPTGVSINEAIEIAKKFSTVKSGAFINGVLDGIKRRFAIEKESSRNIATYK